METPISYSQNGPPRTLETLRPGDGVWFVTGGIPPRIEQGIAIAGRRAIRWPASIDRFVDDRADGRMDLSVLTHAGTFRLKDIPYDEGRTDHTWHLIEQPEVTAGEHIVYGQVLQCIDGEVIARAALPFIMDELLAGVRATAGVGM